MVRAKEGTAISPKPAAPDYRRAPEQTEDARKDWQSVEGKAVVLTGGTKGIGRATAALLTARGAKVLVFGRHEEELNDALDAFRPLGQIHGLVADQSKPEDVQRVFGEADRLIGGCDILINNAAVAGGKVEEVEPDQIAYMLQTNLFGYIACTQEALKRMKKKEDGHVVFVGSMSADLREEGGSVYVATKAGIQAFAESLRKTASDAGIRVSLVEPGAVATPLQQKPAKKQAKRIESMDQLDPDDVAECIHYCLIQPKRCDIVSVQIRPLKQLI